MEGSIADSTTQRIRSSLQRTGLSQSRVHGQSMSGQGLFEELLKLPSQTVGKDQSPEDLVADSLAPSAEATKPSLDDEDQTDVEASQEDEAPLDESDSLDCYLAVCPPPQISVAEPEQPEADSELTPERTVATSVDAPAVEKLDSELQVVPAVEPVTIPLEDDENIVTLHDEPDEQGAPPSAQPIESSLSTIPAAIKPMRSDRVGERSGNHKPTEALPKNTEAEGTLDVQGKPDPKQPTANLEPISADANATSPDIEPTESKERDEPREKWYEARRDSGVEDAQTSDNSANADDRQSASQDSQTTIAADYAEPSDTSGGFELAGLELEMTANLPMPDDNSQALAAATSALASTVGSSASTSAGSSASEAGARRSAMATGTVSGGTSGVGSGSSPSIGSASANGTNTSTVGGQDARATDKANSDSDVRQLTQQERVRLVQRVARSFSRLGPEGGQVTLKLHPPQLGVLNVSIRIEGQSMSAKLQTESTAARDVILDNLPQLRDRLAEQGIKVEQFQVDVGSSSDMASGGQASSSNGDSSSSGNRSDGSTTIDYRRVSRAATNRPDSVSLGYVPYSNQPSTIDRSLDVRV